jgi:hypothetical protein
VFGSDILEVAIGLVFSFLAISLFTSAAVEGINSALKTRARNLKTGIMALVNDPNFEKLARSLYQHALISPLAPGPVVSADPKVPDPSAKAYDKWGNLPSYIDKQQFARAFLDVTKLSEKGAQSAQALKAQIGEIQDPQIKLFLQGVFDRVGSDVSKIETEIADWFDGAMDRLSGVFKRRTQRATFVIALIVAAVVNIDSIKLGTALWENHVVREELGKFVTSSPVQLPQQPAQAVPQAEQALSIFSTLMEDGLPVGWPTGHLFEAKSGQKDKDNSDILVWFWDAPKASPLTSTIGWIITAVSALFGAPFWFDTLQTLIRLKGAGPSPAEKQNKTAASS